MSYTKYLNKIKMKNDLFEMAINDRFKEEEEFEEGEEGGVEEERGK